MPSRALRSPRRVIFSVRRRGDSAEPCRQTPPPLMLDFLAFLESKLREVQAHRPTLGPRVKEAQAHRHTGTQAHRGTGPVHSHAPARAHVRTHMLPGTRLREAQEPPVPRARTYPRPHIHAPWRTSANIRQRTYPPYKRFYTTTTPAPVRAHARTQASLAESADAKPHERTNYPYVMRSHQISLAELAFVMHALK